MSEIVPAGKTVLAGDLNQAHRQIVAFGQQAAFLLRIGYIWTAGKAQNGPGQRQKLKADGDHSGDDESGDQAENPGPDPIDQQGENHIAFDQLVGQQTENQQANGEKAQQADGLRTIGTQSEILQIRRQNFEIIKRGECGYNAQDRHNQGAENALLENLEIGNNSGDHNQN